LEPHPELQQLQTRYEIMTGQPYASQEASNELTTTREALAMGREAHQDRDEDALAHYLFVADKNMDIAQVRLNLFETNSAIASASADRERLLRQIRERQLAEAQSDTRAAQNVADRRGEALATQEQQLSRQQQ